MGWNEHRRTVPPFTPPKSDHAQQGAWGAAAPALCLTADATDIVEHFPADPTEQAERISFSPVPSAVSRPGPSEPVDWALVSSRDLWRRLWVPEGEGREGVLLNPLINVCPPLPRD